MYGYIFKRGMTNMGNPLVAERYQVTRNLAAGLTFLCCNRAFLRAFGRPPNQDRELRFDDFSQGNIPFAWVDDDHAVNAFAFCQVQIVVNARWIVNGLHQQAISAFFTHLVQAISHDGYKAILGNQLRT